MQRTQSELSNKLETLFRKLNVTKKIKTIKNNMMLSLAIVNDFEEEIL